MSLQSNTFVRKKVAIVGSGCSGIAALWALNRTYHDVHLYEAADRLGGHTNTVQWSVGKYKTSVDTGFIVLNSATYRKYTPSLHFSAMPDCLPAAAPVDSQLYKLSQKGQRRYRAHANGLLRLPRQRRL